MVTAIKYNTREEWLKIRRQGVGGSDVSAIMGFNPWRSPIDVWREKTGRDVEPEKNRRALEIGTQLERMVADFYATDTGNRVQNYNFTLKDGIFIGNVDRLVILPGMKTASHQREIRTPVLLECKTSGDYQWDEVPLYYQAQVQHYMGLCPDVERVDVAVYFKSCNGFQIFRVYREPGTIEQMREYLIDWWDEHVKHGNAPEPRNEADCRKIWRYSVGESITASDEIVSAVEDLTEIQTQIKFLEEKQAEKRFQIASYMGENDTLTRPFTGEKLLTYRTTKDREKVDYAGLIQALSVRAGLNESESEALRKKFTTTTPGSRVFRILTKNGVKQ